MGKKGLRYRQSQFALMVAILIIFIYLKGYECTFGDAYARDGHKKDSFHYKRLAIDLNLFLDGEYLTKTEDHAPIGKFWKFLGGTWGGDWGNDGNHYSWGEI